MSSEWGICHMERMKERKKKYNEPMRTKEERVRSCGLRCGPLH